MYFLRNKKLHVLIVLTSKIPALLYGGTERVIWDLGKTLADLGHTISFLVNEGSICPFANVIFFDVNKTLNQQIPEDVDLVHIQFTPNEVINKPYLITIHGNIPFGEELDKQSVFVSKNHAERYDSSQFVYNGLDWDNFPRPNFDVKRESFHFLAKAAWKVKNVRDAIKLTRRAGEKLEVLGGYRLNLKMGPRFTLDTHVRFRGMVDNQKKSLYLNRSKGLIFPILWHEPFGLAIVESLYFGCPVFATPYGSLTELIKQEVGVVSNKKQKIVDGLKDAGSFNKITCHEYAKEEFSALKMAKAYLVLYERVLNGEILNKVKPTLREKSNSKYLQFE